MRLALASSLQYPVVVKARRLSASRGVVRADDAALFVQAVARVHRIQSFADRDAAQLGLIVEAFIPGPEFALEGLLENGALRVLALFDKPDPLDGPYFEETIYVTPSRLGPDAQMAIAADVQRVCTLAGLTSGPVHAEMRVNDQGIWLLEVAARSIGGLCGRALNHRLGMSLEELILRHTLDMPAPSSASSDASGVMMIPVPARGIFHHAAGLMAARAVPGVSDIRITAQPGAIGCPAAGRLRLSRFHLLARRCTGSGRSRAARGPREPGGRDSSRIADDLGLCAMTSPRVSVQATRVRPRSPQGRFRIAHWVINVSVPATCRECLLPGNLGGDVVRPLLADLGR
jgi:hypothetical protein